MKISKFMTLSVYTEIIITVDGMDGMNEMKRTFLWELLKWLIERIAKQALTSTTSANLIKTLVSKDKSISRLRNLAIKQIQSIY